MKVALALRCLELTPTPKNFATISTLLPSGQIQSHVVWVDCDDDHIVINTEIGLRKFKNVQADQRVAVTVWDRKNPYFFAEVRSRVVQTVTGPEARTNIDSLAQRHLDADYPEELIHSERVILKIAPDSRIVFASVMHDIRRWADRPAVTRRLVTLPPSQGCSPYSVEHVRRDRWMLRRR